MQIKDSMECAKSELDLFSVPPTNTAIEDAHWDNIQPHPNFDQSPILRELIHITLICQQPNYMLHLK